MGLNHDIARALNKYDYKKLFQDYKDDPNRYAIYSYQNYSTCYWICLTPHWKKVKRFRCTDCYSNPIYCERDELKHNQGCMGDASVKVEFDYTRMAELRKEPNGEIWLYHNKKASKILRAAWREGVHIPATDWQMANANRPAYTGNSRA